MDDLLLDRVESRLREARHSPSVEAGLAEARRRADAVDAVGNGAEVLAATVLAADGLVALASHGTWAPGVADNLVAELADVLHVDTAVVGVGLGLTAFRSPTLRTRPAATAIAVVLRVLFELSGALAVSCWSRDVTGRLRYLASVGGTRPSRGERSTARRLLDGEQASRAGLLRSFPVGGGDRPDAALVVRLRPGAAGRPLPLPGEAALALAPLVAEELHTAERQLRERALLETAERRFSRLAYDLHDGPIQDVVALATDLHLFRRQLEIPEAADDDGRRKLAGRVDDLGGRLAAIDRELRQFAESYESPRILQRPLADTISREVETFRTRSGIEAALAIRGTFDDLTDSQRIAVARIVQEALTNAREHSRASKVEVSIDLSGGEVVVGIVDDGNGFDVDRALVRGVQQGRLGIVGMSERVRLLGGTFSVESSPGGPTRVSMTLPEWRGPDADAPG